LIGACGLFIPERSEGRKFFALQKLQPNFPPLPKPLCKLWTGAPRCKSHLRCTPINPAQNCTLHFPDPQIHMPFPPRCGNRATLGTQFTPVFPPFHLPSIPQPGFLKLAPTTTPNHTTGSAGFPLFLPQRVLRRGYITLSSKLFRTPSHPLSSSQEKQLRVPHPWRSLIPTWVGDQTSPSPTSTGHLPFCLSFPKGICFSPA